VVATEPDDAQDPDTITTYLADPVVKPSVIKEAGGIMKYWDQAAKHRPQVAKMGLDFCSAPGERNVLVFFISLRYYYSIIS
jgi:hypothetical protein